MMGAAAALVVIVALSTSADASDLSSPPPSRARPHRALAPLSARFPDHVLIAAPPGHPASADKQVGGTIIDWGTNISLDGPPSSVPTDPSGLISATRFDSEYQFSPDWLTDAAGEGSLEYREFRR